MADYKRTMAFANTKLNTQDERNQGDKDRLVIAKNVSYKKNGSLTKREGFEKYNLNQLNQISIDKTWDIATNGLFNFYTSDFLNIPNDKMGTKFKPINNIDFTVSDSSPRDIKNPLSYTNPTPTILFDLTNSAKADMLANGDWDVAKVKQLHTMFMLYDAFLSNGDILANVIYSSLIDNILATLPKDAVVSKEIMDSYIIGLLIGRETLVKKLSPLIKQYQTRVGFEDFINQMNSLFELRGSIIKATTTSVHKFFKPSFDWVNENISSVRKVSNILTSTYIDDINASPLSVFNKFTDSQKQKMLKDISDSNDKLFLTSNDIYEYVKYHIKSNGEYGDFFGELSNFMINELLRWSQDPTHDLKNSPEEAQALNDIIMLTIKNTIAIDIFKEQWITNKINFFTKEQEKYYFEGQLINENINKKILINEQELIQRANAFYGNAINDPNYIDERNAYVASIYYWADYDSWKGKQSKYLSNIAKLNPEYHLESTTGHSLSEDGMVSDIKALLPNGFVSSIDMDTLLDDVGFQLIKDYQSTTTNSVMLATSQATTLTNNLFGNTKYIAISSNNVSGYATAAKFLFTPKGASNNGSVLLAIPKYTHTIVEKNSPNGIIGESLRVEQGKLKSQISAISTTPEKLIIDPHAPDSEHTNQNVVLKVIKPTKPTWWTDQFLLFDLSSSLYRLFTYNATGNNKLPQPDIFKAIFSDFDKYDQSAHFVPCKIFGSWTKYFNTDTFNTDTPYIYDINDWTSFNTLIQWNWNGLVYLNPSKTWADIRNKNIDLTALQNNTRSYLPSLVYDYEPLVNEIRLGYNTFWISKEAYKRWGTLTDSSPEGDRYVWLKTYELRRPVKVKLGNYVAPENVDKIKDQAHPIHGGTLIIALSNASYDQALLDWKPDPDMPTVDEMAIINKHIYEMHQELECMFTASMAGGSYVYDLIADKDVNEYNRTKIVIYNTKDEATSGKCFTSWMDDAQFRADTNWLNTMQPSFGTAAQGKVNTYPFYDERRLTNTGGAAGFLQLETYMSTDSTIRFGIQHYEIDLKGEYLFNSVSQDITAAVPYITGTDKSGNKYTFKTDGSQDNTDILINKLEWDVDPIHEPAHWTVNLSTETSKARTSIFDFENEFVDNIPEYVNFVASVWDGKMYFDSVTQNNLPLVLANNGENEVVENFNTSNIIDWVKYDNKIFITTGNGIYVLKFVKNNKYTSNGVVKGDDKVYALVEKLEDLAYTPNAQEYTLLGPNVFAHDMELKDVTSGLPFALEFIVMNPYKGQVGREATFKVVMDAPTDSYINDVSFVWEYMSSNTAGAFKTIGTDKTGEVTGVVDANHKNRINLTFSAEDVYTIKCTATYQDPNNQNNKNVLVTLTKYVVGDSETNIKTPEPLAPQINKCRRVLLNKNVLLFYGDGTTNVYGTAPDNPYYFPFGNTISIDTNKSEPVTTLVNLKDMVLAFTKSTISAITGAGNPVTVKELFNPFLVVQIESRVGSIGLWAANNIENTAVFMSDIGCYIVEQVYLSEKRADLKNLDAGVQNIMPKSVDTTIYTADRRLHISDGNTKTMLVFDYEFQRWTTWESNFTGVRWARLLRRDGLGDVLYVGISNKILKKQPLFSTLQYNEFNTYPEHYFQDNLDDYTFEIQTLKDNGTISSADFFWDGTFNFKRIKEFRLRWIMNQKLLTEPILQIIGGNTLVNSKTNELNNLQYGNNSIVSEKNAFVLTKSLLSRDAITDINGRNSYFNYIVDKSPWYMWFSYNIKHTGDAPFELTGVDITFDAGPNSRNRHGSIS